MDRPLPHPLNIPNLGPRPFPSPGLQKEWGKWDGHWVRDSDRILLNDRLESLWEHPLDASSPPPSVELAGPRKHIFFRPEQTTLAVMTCGGICPGLNNVIRDLVMHAHYGYGSPRILGLRYGFEALNPTLAHSPLLLTPDFVDKIHLSGGSVLGTSRGKQDAATMADQLLALGIDILFVVGGDGSQRGALEIHQELQARKVPIAVVGIPKTIDNDLLYMDRSFGYQTACAEACRTLGVAHAEARSTRNGVGLVKLMGRDSGFIACAAALASGEVNFVLIPEVPFETGGPHGLLAHLEKRVQERGHAVIAVSEGAGQDLFPSEARERDASGNLRYRDIGLHLKSQIEDHFRAKGMHLNLKYIDPSYEVRGGVASSEDRIFCLQLARHAVHAGMAGKSGVVVARWHQRFVHLPMPLVAQGRRTVDLEGDLWRCVLESTGQPAQMHHNPPQIPHL